MVGPPGAGKSMLVARLPGLLPPLDASEILEISMIRSLAGELQSGRLTAERSFRNPHHTASTPALIGGGHRIKPGEVSLSHFGVLFLDELPEFQRGALEALRQPLETGRATIVRANAHVTYPASFQLVAAMNPCRCGHLDNPAEACSQAPKCADTYQSRISGSLFDRIDLHIDVPAVNPADLGLRAVGKLSRHRGPGRRRPYPAETSLSKAGGEFRRAHPRRSRRNWGRRHHPRPHSHRRSAVLPPYPARPGRHAGQQNRLKSTFPVSSSGCRGRRCGTGCGTGPGSCCVYNPWAGRR